MNVPVKSMQMEFVLGQKKVYLGEMQERYVSTVAVIYGHPHRKMI